MKDSWPLKGRAARAEDKLLLSCARVRVGADAAARVKSLASEATDWGYLSRLARRHAILPLLHRNIGEHARDFAPPDFLQNLGDSYRKNATRNLLLAGEVVRVVRLFESGGAPALAYKGPALAVQAYGDISLRRFVDLDLIVRRGDVRRAGELLRSLGFELQGGLSEAHEKFLLRTQHGVAYTRAAGLLTVELHWEFAPRSFAELPLGEAAWARAVSVGLCGGQVKTLSPEDSLLALCVHGTKHLWGRLSHVCDVAELLNSHPELDFGYALALARESRTERMLLLGLRLARGLLDATLPAPVVAQAEADEEVESLCAAAAENLFAGAAYGPVPLAGSVGFNLRARPRLREKVRYFRHVLTPNDADFQAFALPESLSFIYYLLRPVRLISKRGGGG
jgi:hypothetical protein